MNGWIGDYEVQTSQRMRFSSRISLTLMILFVSHTLSLQRVSLCIHLSYSSAPCYNSNLLGHHISPTSLQIRRDPLLLLINFLMWPPSIPQTMTSIQASLPQQVLFNLSYEAKYNTKKQYGIYNIHVIKDTHCIWTQGLDSYQSFLGLSVIRTFNTCPLFIKDGNQRNQVF